MQRKHVGLILSTLMAAGTAAAAEQVPDTHAPDTMQARVLACAACHGANGEGTSNAYFPRLAGKPLAISIISFWRFRSGRRHYPPMNYLIEYLPEDYLREMSEYFAAQRPPLPTPAVADVSKEVLDRGQEIVSRGGQRAWHPGVLRLSRKTLTGMEPAIPGLLGLRASYISAQLGGWRYGTRTAAAPDCMQIVASHLTEKRCAGRCRLSLVTGRAGRSLAGAPGQLYAPPYMRKRTTMTNVGEHISKAVPALLGGCRFWRSAGRRFPRSEKMHRRPARPHPRSSQKENIWRERAIASLVIRHPTAKRFAGGPCDADTVRDALYVQHHAGQGNRDRHVECGPVLRDNAHRTLSRRRADLSGDAVRFLYESDARGQRRDSSPI